MLFICNSPYHQKNEKLVVSARVSAERFSGGEVMKRQDREIAPISLPPFYQWRGQEGHWAMPSGHALSAHLKGTLHQEPRV